MMFVQHGDSIYEWTRQDKESFSEKPFFVSKTSSEQFLFIDMSRFLILETKSSLEGNKELHYQEIKLIECKFSNYYCQVVYKEPSVLEDIISFNIDYEKMYLFIITKVWNETDERFRDKMFELYDLNHNKSMTRF